MALYPFFPSYSCLTRKSGLAQVYIRGQEEQYEYEDHDFEFCGKDLPQTVQTPGPRLVLLFNAGARSGSGFKVLIGLNYNYI